MDSFTKNKRVLIVEDEVIIRASLDRLLSRNGYDVEVAGHIEEAKDKNLDSFDLIISDLRLPKDEGTALIELTKTPVLIMTSFASMRSAVDSMKMGAADYIAKPFNHQSMLNAVAEICTRMDAQNREKTAVNKFLSGNREIKLSKKESHDTVNHQHAENTEHFFVGEMGMIGNCKAMQTLYRNIEKVAPTQATVLIRGESGTGKELVAKALHRNSLRKNASMISVNCAAIPENLIESELFGHEKGAFTGASATRNGIIEAADGGTLFLDEIGELPLEAQARLLRVLQEGEIRKVGSVYSKKVDIRLIAATHKNLKAMARENKFREDLYYRLNVVELYLPLLRERGEDIIMLAKFIMKKMCQRMNINVKIPTPATIDAIRTYSWPGNVRELENAIERALILCENDVITPELLRIDLTNSSLYQTDGSTLSHDSNNVEPSLEKYFHKFVLDNQEVMNETQLAEKLGISRKCLWERRKRFGIQRAK